MRNGPLDYEEALEMAYENIQGEAAHAIKGKRRPRGQEDAGIVISEERRPDVIEGSWERE